MMGLTSSKKSHFSFILFSQRDICCLHLVLFVMPCIGGFYGRKIKEGEARTLSLGECFQDWAEGAAVGSAAKGQVRQPSQSLPSTWVDRTGPDGLECHTKQLGRAWYPRRRGAKKRFREGYDMVTQCFAAIPLVRYMKRKNWRGTTREGKKAETSSKTCKGTTRLGCKFSHICPKPDVEI